MHASIHRAALAVSGVAVVTVVGGFLIADGYLAARGQAAGGLATSTVQGPLASMAAAASASPQVVYVRPAPSPQVIHVTQPAPAAPPRVVHVTVPGTGGENDGGSEGGND